MRHAGITAVLIVVAFSCAGIVLAQAQQAPVQLKALSFDSTAEGVLVLVRTSGGTPQYQATRLDSPPRLVIDLEGAVYAAGRSRWPVAPDPIKEVRGSQFRPTAARVVVELSQSAEYRIERSADGLRVVFELPTGQPAAPVGASPAPPVAAAAVSLPARGTASVPDAAPATERAAAIPMPEVVPAPAALRNAAADPSAPELTVAQAAPSAAPEPSGPSPAPTAPPAIAQAAPATPAQSSPAAPPPAPAPAPAPLPTTPPPSGIVQSTPTDGGKLITLEFKDADVVNLLRILAAESNRNMVVGDDVKGKVSVSLRNVTWEQALDTILEVKGLRKIEKDNVMRIISYEALTRDREAQIRADEARRKAQIELEKQAAEAKLKELEAQEQKPRYEIEARIRLAEARLKLAEAERKELEVAKRRLADEAAAAETAARGPLREEMIRLTYADPKEVAKTLRGILGIRDEDEEQTAPAGLVPAVVPSQGVTPSGPLIAEPPFAQLYGMGLQPRPQPVVSVSQDVINKGITIRAYPPTNSIFIRHYAADIERLKKLLREQLDVPLPQVKIEARMEILERSALEQIGVQWGGATVMHPNPGKVPALVGRGFSDPLLPGGTPVLGNPGPNPNFTPGNIGSPSSFLPIDPFTGVPTGGNIVNLPITALPTIASPAFGALFGIVGKNFNLDLALQALATQGKTRTLARPEIITMENNKAAVSLGEEIPYATVSSAGTQIQFKEALLKLEVTPTVLGEKVGDRENTRIKMVVIVENNSRGEVVNLGTSGQPPAINRRKAETLVLITEGERLVIGGVTTAVKRDTVRKVPLLGDIPLLGWLFKQKETSEDGRELVVFITPSVLRGLASRVAAPPAGR